MALEVTKIKTFLEEKDIDFINLYRSDNRTMTVVTKYINFIKTHKRYPLITSNDEEEKALLNDYIRNKPYFNENEKRMLDELKKVINSREAMQNAYIEMLNQKKRR